MTKVLAVSQDTWTCDRTVHGSHMLDVREEIASYVVEAIGCLQASDIAGAVFLDCNVE